VSDDAVVVPVTSELDLHSFAPEDVPSLVEEYLTECLRKGIARVRIVHGRGRGVQRAVVRRKLTGLAFVRDFCDAPPGEGGWGATLVLLSEK